MTYDDKQALVIWKRIFALQSQIKTNVDGLKRVVKECDGNARN